LFAMTWRAVSYPRITTGLSSRIHVRE
jgi:hypothetical protein